MRSPTWLCGGEATLELAQLFILASNEREMGKSKQKQNKTPFNLLIPLQTSLKNTPFLG